MFSAGFGSSSIAVIAPRCAAPRKLELTSVAVRHDPLLLLLLVTGLQRNVFHCLSNYRFVSINCMWYFWKVSRLRKTLQTCFTPVVPTRLWWCQVKSWPFPSLSVAILPLMHRSKYTNVNKIKHFLTFVLLSCFLDIPGVSSPAGLCRSPPLMIAGGRVFVIPCIQQIQRLAFK